MKKYRLIVDSCCERIPLLSENEQVHFVPLSILAGGECIEDIGVLSSTQILRKISSASGRVTSSCPPPAAYAEAYATGCPTFVLTVSAQLSGSYSSALAGRSITPDEDISVFDSKTASAGETLAALRMLDIIQTSDSSQEVMVRGRAALRTIHTYFVLESTDMLVRSGRMPRYASTVASVLRLRPVLGADEEGNIQLICKARGTQNALQELIRLWGSSPTAQQGAPRTLVISHCDNAAAAMLLKKAALAYGGFHAVYVTRTGGISSLYADKGGIIIAFD